MRSLILFTLLFVNLIISAQSLEGSWKMVEENGEKVTDKSVIRIYQDNYFTEAAKKTSSNEFLWALGGEFKTDDYSVIQDFNTRSPELVGEKLDPKLSFLSKDKIKINEATVVQLWTRISNNENDLDGNWVITGRQQNGNLNKIVPGDRRTIKILGGDRFQWVAFNSATREFFGTGGGTYSAKNGRYFENIDYFSRDKNRVGARLEFEYKIKEGEWHHSGKSSKGDSIYEIWSKHTPSYSR